MPAVFGHQHRGDHRLGGQARLDQMLFGRRLRDLLAGPAGELGAMGDNDPVLRRDHIEPLCRVFADHMHRRLAARAIRAGRRNRLVDARQMDGKCTAIDLALRARHERRLLLLDGIPPGERALDVFERQRKLIGRKPGQPLAFGVEALGFAQELAKVLVHCLQPVALGSRCIALGKHCQGKGAQAFDVLRKRIRLLFHNGENSTPCAICQLQ
jgi:hypothetical protein